MSYDTYPKNSDNPPRNSYDSFPARTNNNFPERNKKNSFEEIELGEARSRIDQEDRFGASFDLLEVRRSFIRKVYGIVGFELLLVSSTVAIFMFSPLRDLVYGNQSWLTIFYVLMFVPLAIVLILTCCPVDKVLRKWPLNIFLLTVLALSEGVVLGIISAYYKQESIMIAGGLTAATVLVVSIFAFFTKIDFTKYSGIIFILLVLLMIFGIATIIVGFLADDYTRYVMKMIYGALGAFVMVILLIVDTQMMIIGKHKYSYNPEDYVYAALSIFLDIINLFIFILILVGGER